MTKAVFLDRDGVLNEERGYINKISDFRIFPFTAECVKRLHEAGFLAVVVSNQSGIGRGFLTLDELRAMNALMTEKTAVDDIFFCPNHPEAVIEEYRGLSHDRKPDTGMIEKAVAKYDIDLERSWVVGDRICDIELGVNAGIEREHRILVESPMTEETEIDAALYGARVKSLEEAVEFIVHNDR